MINAKLLLGTLLLYTSLHAHMERNDDTDIITDPQMGLMWQDDRITDTLLISWDEAMRYCETLVFGGYDDWRLPSKQEMLSTIDPDRCDHEVQGAMPINIHFLHKHPDVYWVSDTVKTMDELAWRVHFDNGEAHWGPKRFEFHVRCVRELEAE